VRTHTKLTVQIRSLAPAYPPPQIPFVCLDRITQVFLPVTVKKDAFLVDIGE